MEVTFFAAVKILNANIVISGNFLLNAKNSITKKSSNYFILNVL